MHLAKKLTLLKKARPYGQVVIKIDTINLEIWHGQTSLLKYLVQMLIILSLTTQIGQDKC